MTDIDEKPVRGHSWYNLCIYSHKHMRDMISLTPSEDFVGKPASQRHVRDTNYPVFSFVIFTCN